uniref:Uncharacterized protein n=1 Tax=Panagrolaimus superbus TaxID=310955 RepID=A0A914XYH5_9BILA
MESQASPQLPGDPYARIPGSNYPSPLLSHGASPSRSALFADLESRSRSRTPRSTYDGSVLRESTSEELEGNEQEVDDDEETPHDEQDDEEDDD